MNRADRRRKIRSRVRNKSWQTTHPKIKKFACNRYYQMKDANLIKNMSNAMKQAINDFGTAEKIKSLLPSKWLGLFRKLFS